MKINEIFSNQLFCINTFQINLNGEEYESVAKNLRSSVAVDYHFRLGLFFWTDTALDAIMVTNKNGTPPASK